MQQLEVRGYDCADLPADFNAWVINFNAGC